MALMSSPAVAAATREAAELGKRAARQMRQVDAWAEWISLPQWDRQMMPRKRDLGSMLHNAILAPMTARSAARAALKVLGRE